MEQNEKRIKDENYDLYKQYFGSKTSLSSLKITKKEQSKDETYTLWPRGVVGGHKLTSYPTDSVHRPLPSVCFHMSQTNPKAFANA